VQAVQAKAAKKKKKQKGDDEELLSDAGSDDSDAAGVWLACGCGGAEYALQVAKPARTAHGAGMSCVCLPHMVIDPLQAPVAALPPIIELTTDPCALLPTADAFLAGEEEGGDDGIGADPGEPPWTLPPPCVLLSTGVRQQGSLDALHDGC
jgi:hypothetical protein